MGEDKRHPFQKRFEILGAVVTLPEVGPKVIEVANKQTRLEQIALQAEDEELSGQACCQVTT